MPILENVRRKLRRLVRLIEPKDRKIVYTDFEDEIRAAIEMEAAAARPIASGRRPARSTTIEGSECERLGAFIREVVGRRAIRAPPNHFA
ncbi:MAG TPA: hypothetical protein VIF61_05445 [Methylocystis sp.]